MPVTNSNESIGAKEDLENKSINKLNNAYISPGQSENSPDLTINIKVVDGETGEFAEKFLTAAQDRKTEWLIGRHPSCDLVLDSEEISRIHGRIWCHEQKCFFADLGSTGGSQIDGKEAEINQVQLLRQNNLLHIGSYVLNITTLAADESTPQLESLTEQDTVHPGSQRHWNSGKLTVRCIQVIDETHDVKTFRFVAEPTVLFSYQPGQFVTLELEIDGTKVRRSYTISSTPSRPNVLEVTVKRVMAPANLTEVSPGLVSNWLHDHISVGSRIKLQGPMGQFTCATQPAPKLLLISAGSGITPMMSMSRWLCDRGTDVDIVFIHSARTPRDIIYRQELESLAARYKNFKLAITITRSEPGYPWSGYKGRLNEAMLQAIAPDWLERSVYVCGANLFMQGVKTMLEALGLPGDKYHQESFGEAPKKLLIKHDASEQSTIVNSNIVNFKPGIDKDHPLQKSTQNNSPSESPVIVLKQKGAELPGDADETILETAEEAGFELPYGCRMGACGACKLPLISGEVQYDSDPDCELQHILTCIAKPMGRVVIQA